MTVVDVLQLEGKHSVKLYDDGTMAVTRAGDEPDAVLTERELMAIVELHNRNV